MANSAYPEREKKRRSLHRLRRRKLLCVAALIGGICGSLAVLYRIAFERIIEAGIQLTHWSIAAGPLAVIVTLTAGGMSAAGAALLVERISPDAAGSGIPHIKAVLMHVRPLHSMRVLFVKFFGGLLAAFPGMSLGREGPTIQMGAACANAIAKVFRVSQRSRIPLIAAGGGAGLAAAFNAPLAGFIFVLEELRRELSTSTYLSAFVACVSSVLVTRFLVGQDPSFSVPIISTIPLRAFVGVLFVGLICGLVGVAFNRLTMSGFAIRDKKRIPRWLAAGVAGIVSIACLMLLPAAAGPGNWVVKSLLEQNISIDSVPLVLIFKLLLTVICFSSGVPGGIFAPLLVLGALSGTSMYLFLPTYLTSDLSIAAASAIGMAAILASSIRAPLTGIILIVEMTEEYHLLYPLLLASFAAYVVAELLHNKPIYESLLERDLHHRGQTELTSHGIVEIFVEPNSRMDGRSIRALSFPSETLITLIDRGNETLLANGTTKLLAGDMLTIFIGSNAAADASLVMHDLARSP